MNDELPNINHPSSGGMRKPRLILVWLLSFFLLLAIVSAVVIYFKDLGPKVNVGGDMSAEKGNLSTDKATYEAVAKGLEVSSPISGDTVRSPLVVKGRVGRSWLFEGSFTAKLIDSKGNVFSSAPAYAKDDWTEKDPTDFLATLKFSEPNDKDGFLILEADNMTGIPAHDKSVTIPVKFDSNFDYQNQNPVHVSGSCGKDPKDDPILGDCGDDCDTAKWKIYRNKKYGYSFRYPPDYLLSSNCKGDYCVVEEKGGDSVRLSGEFSGGSWPLIMIRHLSNEHYNPPKDYPVAEWIMEKFSWTKKCFPMEANIYFSGPDGRMYPGFNIYFPQGAGVLSRREIYFADETSRIFEISMLDVDSPQARQFYDIWLSTFHFKGE